MSDRRCADPDCTTILSRFNKGKYCSVCERKHPTSTRKGRPPGAKNKPKVKTAPIKSASDSRLTNGTQTDAIVDSDDDLEKLAEATWMEATGDGERVRLDLRLGNNVILARCYISNAKAKQLAALIDRVSG